MLSVKISGIYTVVLRTNSQSPILSLERSYFLIGSRWSATSLTASQQKFVSSLENETSFRFPPILHHHVQHSTKTDQSCQDVESNEWKPSQNTDNRNILRHGPDIRVIRNRIWSMFKKVDNKTILLFVISDSFVSSFLILISFISFF